MRQASFALAMALVLAGCPAPGGPKPVGKPTAEPGAKASVKQGTIGALRPVPQQGQRAAISGQVRLISDHGSGIVSNNTGSVLSNNGGTAISDNGAGAISDNGAGYRLAQQGARAEARLADATVEALDAAGRLLTDEAGKPLSAVSGPDGRFTFQAVLPAEAVVLRVKLVKAGKLKGGELRALLAKDAPRQGTLDLDTAASLGASFVLETYVKGEQDVLDKLPAREAQLLRAAVGLALGGEAAVPGYEPAAQAALAGSLRGRDAGLDARLDAIEAILLAGQSELGRGLAATRVAIVEPVSLNGDDRGGLLVGEAITGRVRRIGADGAMGLYVDAEVGEHKLDLSRAASHRVGPDGALYVCEILENRIRRLHPDGRLEIVAQNAVAASGLAGGAQPDFAPRSIAFGPQGQLYVGEEGRGIPPQVVELKPDGTRPSLGRPPGVDLHDWPTAGLEAGPDGAIYALFAPFYPAPTDRAILARRAPDGTWTVVSQALRCSKRTGLLLEPDGSLLVAEDQAQRVTRVAPDGGLTPIAGTGEPGDTGDGGPATQARLAEPAALYRAPDGTLYVASAGSGLIRAIAPDGTIRTVAGLAGVTGVGDALRAAINQPTGLAVGPRGELAVAETAANTIKRLEGGALSLLAGTVAGFAGDGGPAAQARLSGPEGLAYGPDGSLYVSDNGNKLIRKIDPAGGITTFGGMLHTIPNGKRATYEDQPSNGVWLTGATAIALGPDGAVYGVAEADHQVWRLGPDGNVRVVAGALHARGVARPEAGDAGDDGQPGRDARFRYPTGLAFRPGANPPELYVSDTGNCKIKRIVDPGGPNPTVSAVVGKSVLETVLRLQAGEIGSGPVARGEALLIMPLAIAFDARGDLFVAEGGTRAARASGFSGELGADLAQLPRLGGRIRKVPLGDPAAPVTTVAGAGGQVLAGGGDDGLTLVRALAVDRDGRLVVADTLANQLKLVPAEVLR